MCELEGWGVPIYSPTGHNVPLDVTQVVNQTTRMRDGPGRYPRSMTIPIPTATAFLALAFLFTLTIIRGRTGPTILTATGNARIYLLDLQALQLRL